MKLKLRDYQEEALDKILAEEADGCKKQLVVIPTGGGKTVVFAALPEYRKASTPMLVLAHRSELLDQAKEKIGWANPDLDIQIEQGQNYAGHVDVVVASVPTLGRANSKRLSSFPRDYFKTIIVDEAHHAAATTYKRVLDYFQPHLTLGVTATPQRGDNVRLTDVFDKVTYYLSIEDLIRRDYLAPLVGYRIDTETDISKVTIRNGDYADGELAEAIDTPERNARIVKAWQELTPGEQTIAFCATIAHAEHLTAVFSRAGIKAAIVTGETPRDERAALLKRFQTGEITVVCNVGVLTEGFDEPSVTCIILARPTRSTLLYTQIVGRGTRLFEGKKRCAVLDFADVSGNKKPLGLPTLMGLPPDFNLEGGDLIEIADEFKKLEAKAPNEAASVLSLSDIKLAWKRVNLFAPPPPNQAILQYSKLIWTEVGPDNYYLGINLHESLHLNRDPLGLYHVAIKSKDAERELGYAESLEEAFGRSDRWVERNRREALSLLDSSAVWRKDPPTDKQVKWLVKFGVPITTDMTKGQASQILDKLFADNPPKPKSAKQQWAINQAKLKKGF